MSFPHSFIWIMLTTVLIAFRFLLYKNIFHTVDNETILI